MQDAQKVEGGEPVAGQNGRLAAFLVDVWDSPVRAGLAAAAVYTLLATILSPNRLGQSGAPYFVYLANAFLHGQLALVDTPPRLYDLSVYQGRYYLYWPPFPALLFVPLVALVGIGVSDVPLTLAVAGLNVALVSLLLKALDERKIADLPAEKRAWLTAFFAFGTVHVTLAPYARVWFTSQLVAFGLVCAAYLVALRIPKGWGPLAAGTLVACAFLPRNPTLFAGFWVAWYLFRERDRSKGTETIRTALASLAPVGVADALLAEYNYARFGNPLETAFAYNRMSPFFRAEFERLGGFSLHYLGTNLFHNFVGLPYLALFGEQPQVDFWMGGSLFLMSPVFLLAIPGVLRSWKAHGWVLAFTCLAGMIPVLLLMNTGWKQFGPRYTLDITVPLMVAAALGAATVSTRLLAWLSVISIAVYVTGAVLLSRVI